MFFTALFRVVLDYSNLKQKAKQCTENLGLLWQHTARPCIRLVHGKFELTNQDLAGEKNSSVQTSS